MRVFRKKFSKKHHPNPDVSPSSILPILRDIAFGTAVYLYFIGFVYIRTYYNTFGISGNVMDIPIYNYITYSFNPLIGLLWVTGLIILGLLICFAFLSNKWGNRIEPKIALLICLFPLSAWLAQNAGTKDASGIINNYQLKHISFILKDNNIKYPEEFIAANTTKRLFLITETKETYFALDSSIKWNYLIEIPKSDISMSMVDVSTT